MTISLVLLALLTAPYAVARLGRSVLSWQVDTRTAGCVGLGLVFLMTGIGHFVKIEEMVAMLPPWTPQRTMLVYSTGVLELLLATAFFVPAWRRAAGFIAVVLLCLFFPVNVYAAIHRIPFGGHEWGPAYLLIRAPLQALMAWWACWFAIRRCHSHDSHPPARSLPST